MKKFEPKFGYRLPETANPPEAPSVDCGAMPCSACIWRAKYLEARRYLRAANKGAERNAMVAELATARGSKLFREIEECRKVWGEERTRLIAALHDAIRRPLGVVPASAEEFYEQNVEWWHRRDQAPIQLRTLSPVATHDLLALGFVEWLEAASPKVIENRKQPDLDGIQRCYLGRALDLNHICSATNCAESSPPREVGLVAVDHNVARARMDERTVTPLIFEGLDLFGAVEQTNAIPLSKWAVDPIANLRTPALDSPFKFGVLTDTEDSLVINSDHLASNDMSKAHDFFG